MNKNLIIKEVHATEFVGAIDIVKTAVEKSGFGVLYEIDFKKKIQEKLGKEINECYQLGICNPVIGFNVLNESIGNGCLLPCPLCIYTQGNKYFASMVKPTYQLGVAENEKLISIASEADVMIDSLFSLV